MIELWQFTRSHPDCGHCKNILQSITIWPKETHMTCPCICHTQMRDWYLNGETKKRRRGATK